jgi:hypothetical protein
MLTGVNFISFLHTNFSYEHCFSSFFYVHVTRAKLPKRHLFKKFARKMLMKLTAGVIQTFSKILCFGVGLCNSKVNLLLVTTWNLTIFGQSLNGS